MRVDKFLKVSRIIGEEKGTAYIKYGGTGTGAYRRRNGGAFLR